MHLFICICLYAFERVDTFEKMYVEGAQGRSWPLLLSPVRAAASALLRACSTLESAHMHVCKCMCVCVYVCMCVCVYVCKCIQLAV